MQDPAHHDQSKADPIRILHIFGCMNRGGAEMRTLDLMRRIDRTRFQMDFCALSGNQGILDDDIRQLGGEVHYCKLRRLDFNRRFRRLLREGKYDVVHSHVHYFSGYILWLAHKCSISGRIAHFRSSTGNDKNSLRRKIQTHIMRKLINRHATDILAVGEGTMFTAWRADWDKDPRCVVIPNGLDTSPFHQALHSSNIYNEFNIPHNTPVLVHVGRMSRPKNHVRMAHIAGGVLKRNGTTHFLLLGREDDETKEKMERIFAEGNVSERVHFLGVRDDVPQLLQIADLMLFPSLWEGLPGVVLEACAAGTPVLASDIPGVRELRDRFPIIETLPLDEPDDAWIAKACAMLKKRPTLERRLASLEKTEKSPFHISSCVKAHEKIWANSIQAMPR